MYLTLSLFAVMIICVAMLWNEGFWGNTITLINVIFAALLAMNYFEPLAVFFDSQMKSYTYFWDFLAMWAIFVFSFTAMRVVTDKLTVTKVRFKMPVEQVGRVVMALAVGYVMVAFTNMSLHTAPLPEHAFGGALATASPAPGGIIIDKQLDSSFLGFAPDRQWLGAMQYLSFGPLSRWWDARTFDPDARFLFKYSARRRKLEEYNKQYGEFRVRPTAS